MLLEKKRREVELMYYDFTAPVNLHMFLWHSITQNKVPLELCSLSKACQAASVETNGLKAADLVGKSK